MIRDELRPEVITLLSGRWPDGVDPEQGARWRMLAARIAAADDALTRRAGDLEAAIRGQAGDAATAALAGAGLGKASAGAERAAEITDAHIAAIERQRSALTLAALVADRDARLDVLAGHSPGPRLVQAERVLDALGADHSAATASATAGMAGVAAMLAGAVGTSRPVGRGASSTSSAVRAAPRGRDLAAGIPGPWRPRQRIALGLAADVLLIGTDLPRPYLWRGQRAAAGELLCADPAGAVAAVVGRAARLGVELEALVCDGIPDGDVGCPVVPLGASVFVREADGPAGNGGDRHGDDEGGGSGFEPADDARLISGAEEVAAAFASGPPRDPFRTAAMLAIVAVDATGLGSRSELSTLLPAMRGEGAGGEALFDARVLAAEHDRRAFDARDDGDYSAATREFARARAASAVAAAIALRVDPSRRGELAECAYEADRATNSSGVVAAMLREAS